MADFRLGRLKFNWKGEWAASTAYVIDDIVKYGANTYVCTTNHTSVANENLFYSTDVTKWSLHVEGITTKGDWAANTFGWYNHDFADNMAGAPILYVGDNSTHAQGLYFRDNSTWAGFDVDNSSGLYYKGCISYTAD